MLVAASVSERPIASLSRSRPMRTRSCFLLRFAVVVLLLTALAGIGLAARFVARLDSAPGARAAHAPVLFHPLVGLPWLHPLLAQ